MMDRFLEQRNSSRAQPREPHTGGHIRRRLVILHIRRRRRRRRRKMCRWWL